MGPKAAIEAESKFVKAALRVLFAYAVVSSQKKRFRIGDHDMNPTQSVAIFIKDLIVMDVLSLECSAKRSEGVAVDLASRTNNSRLRRAYRSPLPGLWPLRESLPDFALFPQRHS